MDQEAGMKNDSPSRKPLALLIPGLDGTGRLFCRQAAALEARYRVRAWEFRRRSRFTLDDLVEELAGGTSAEDPASIMVVGESFGGTVAISYVLAYPERVRSLCLINAFPVYRHRLRIHLACRLLPLLRLPGIRRLKDLIAEEILAGEGITKDARKTYHEIIQDVDMESYRQRLEIVRRVNLVSRLPQIEVPTVLLASGRDKLVPSTAEARFMAERIPNSRLHEFPRAGHALLLTPGFQLADYI
jgi:pimeloyl-ACP methyl ester carboxylesterase